MRLKTASRGAAAGAAALALAACSSGADQKNSSQPAGESPQQRLAAVKKVVDQASSMHLKLSSEGVPSSGDGVLGGDGVGTHAPAFKGSLTARVAGVQADVPVVSTGGKTWAKLPIWPSMREIKPKDYGAPDPGKLFSKDQGFSNLLPATQNPAKGGQKRSGSDVVTTYTGKLPGTAVESHLGFGDPSRQYDVTYEVTNDNQLRTAKLKGVFVKGAESTYTLKLDQYGQKVDIQPPA